MLNNDGEAATINIAKSSTMANNKQSPNLSE